MRLGIMTKHLHRANIESVAEAVAGYGLAAVQLNLDSAGLEEIPETFDAATCRRIRAVFDCRGITIAAVSGTFNMIDPNQGRLREHIIRFPTLLDWCTGLGCDVVTACTGTRHPSNMWRHHPDNANPDAWKDLRNALSQLLPIAESRGVTIAFEPEVVNVIDTAEKAQRLIEEIGSSRLRVVLDPANYFHPNMLPRMEEVLEDIFQRVGSYIVLAHAKDVRGPDRGDGECVRPAAGTGVLNYALYVKLLRQSGYDGALVMHSLTEEEVPASAAYVREFLGGAAL
ncbi:MAG: sugar phosphate isomerase/epimerase [Chloroflexi bacterium]|nr:sugar phosphate isomerase/epimerase [Chloroflexota bacterium]